MDLMWIVLTKNYKKNTRKFLEVKDNFSALVMVMVSGV